MAGSNCGNDEIVLIIEDLKRDKPIVEIITVNNKPSLDTVNPTMSSEDLKRDKYIVDRADYQNSESLDTSNGNSLTDNGIVRSDVEKTEEKEANSVINLSSSVINGINTDNNCDFPVAENDSISLSIGETGEKEDSKHDKYIGDSPVVENDSISLSIKNPMMSSEDSKRDEYIFDRADYRKSKSLDTSNGNSLTDNGIVRSDVEKTDKKEANSVINLNRSVINGINTDNNGDFPVVENDMTSLSIRETGEKEDSKHDKYIGDSPVVENDSISLSIENPTMSSEDSKRDKYIIDRADYQNSKTLDTGNGNSLTDNGIVRSDVEKTDEKEANSVIDLNRSVINGINTDNNGDSPVVENDSISLSIGETEEKEVIFVNENNQDNNDSILNGNSVNREGNEGKYETVTNKDEEKGGVELETDDSTVNSNGCSLLSDEDMNPKLAAKPDEDEGSTADVKESVVTGDKIDDVPIDPHRTTPDEAPRPTSEEEPVKIKSWKDVAVNGMKSVPHKAQFKSAKPMVRRYVPKIGKNNGSDNNLKKSEAEFDESVAVSMENKRENGVRVSEPVSSNVNEESKNDSAVQSTNRDRGKEANTHKVTSCRVYKVRVPKLAYEERKNETTSAKCVLDEKTMIRDRIYEEKREQDAKRKKCKLDYDAEKRKENNARAELYAKSNELDSVQKFVSPMLVADIDNEIEELTIRQRYERMPLNKQKEIIKKIGQLEQQKRNIISKQGPHAQNDVIKQEEEHEKKYKELKKEVGFLKALLFKAENNSKSAWDRYANEDKIFNSFRERYNAANEERKKAYLHWTELRKQIDAKVCYFDFRDERKKIDEFKFAGDIQGLKCYCNNQVEKFFERYNNDTEFRNEYVKANFERTIKRLGSPDGRSLVPNEQSLMFGHAQKSSPNVEVSTAVLSIEPEVESSAAKLHNGVLKEQEKGNKLNKEEEENARKEATRKEKKAEEENIRLEEEAKRENLRTERESAELREKIIAEEKEKMVKAEERKKKKKAIKAQKRAEYKAQKEAGEKEKKKAKEHKRQCDLSNLPSVATEVSASNPEKKLPEASQELETSKSEPLKEKNKSRALGRQKKKRNIPKDPLPLPPALRNKRERTMKWMWSIVVVLVLLVIFAAGNYIPFEASWLPSFDL